MRVAKFDVPEAVLSDFLAVVSEKGLESRVGSKRRDEFKVEVEYDKDEADTIDELEEELDSLIDNIEEDEDDQ